MNMTRTVAAHRTKGRIRSTVFTRGQVDVSEWKVYGAQSMQ